MKFKNCFIDNDGNIWKSSTLIKHSKDLPIQTFKVNSISQDQILRWKLVNVHDYCNHFKRVSNADLNSPIILRDDGFIMDGWHRIIKAICTDVKEVPARQFVNVPEPDFKIET